MIERTMKARKLRVVSLTPSILLLSIFTLLLSEVRASLLDPTEIGRELQTFARDALGVDEMQVRTIEDCAKSESMITVQLLVLLV